MDIKKLEASLGSYLSFTTPSQEDIREKLSLANTPGKILLIWGPSGSGKTAVADHFLLDSSTHDHRSIVKIDWASLDDANIESSFAGLLSPGYTDLEAATLSLGPSPAISINDFELTVIYKRQEERALRILKMLQNSRNKPFVIVTSQIPSSQLTRTEEQKALYPRTIDHIFDDTYHLENATWSHLSVPCDDIAYNDFGHIPCSGLTIRLASHLLTYADGRSALINILQNSQGKDLSTITSRLYTSIAVRREPDEQRALSLLLAWASVDPGLDLLDEQVRISLESNGLNFTKEINELFFTSGNKGIFRLTHRSVLDLYSHDVFFNKSDEGFSREEAHSLCHESLLYQYKPTPRDTPSEKSAKIRKAVASIRHALRSRQERTWNDLRMLDFDDFPSSALHELAYARMDFTAAYQIHEKSREDLAGAWYQAPVLSVLSADTLNKMSSRILMWTSRILCAEIAYQALDDWEMAGNEAALAANELSSVGKLPHNACITFSSYRDESKKLDENLKNHYWDMRLLAIGLFATMAYESFYGEVKAGYHDLPSAHHCSKIIADFFENVLMPEGETQLEILSENCRYNEYIGAIKGDPAKLQTPAHSNIWFSPLQPEQWIQELSKWTPDKHAIDHLYNRLSTDSTLSMLDAARYLLSISRQAFLISAGFQCSGPETGLSILEPILRNAVNNQYLRYSQEFYYANTQREFFEIALSGTAPSLKTYLEKRKIASEGTSFVVEDNGVEHKLLRALKAQEDIWAVTWRQAVNTWAEMMDSALWIGDLYLGSESISSTFMRLSTRFEKIGDPKSAMSCKLNALVAKDKHLDYHSINWDELLKQADTAEQEGGEAQIRRYLATDAYFNTIFCHLFTEHKSTEQMASWFPSQKARQRPIFMPGMMILRGVPVAYKPRPDVD